MKRSNNNVTVNAKVEETKAGTAPIEEQEKKDPEATQEETNAEENTQQEQDLPAAVPEVKKGLFRRKTKEEKEAERAEKLAQIDALRADGHRFKAAAADIGLVVGDAAKKAAKVTLGVAAVGGIVVGAVALANRNKEDPESDSGESEDNIIDDPVDENTDEVTSEESEATES